MIRFTHLDRCLNLAPGEVFSLPREQGFRDTATADLLGLIGEIEAGRPWREAVRARYATARPWLHRIITEPARTAFFDQVLPADPGLTLDIGAGWGQVCRELAARRTVVALEPVAERLAFIRAAARQDGVAGRLACIGADYFEVRFETRFNTICAIGVLEWVGAFQTLADPQERQRAFLRKVRAELAPGGCLVLGIENRLGLKYLLGAPDDHTGVPHISVLPAPRARARWKERTQGDLACFTYSQAELALMLEESGFDDVGFFAAFPDYKLPEKIVPLHDGGAGLDAWLAQEAPPADHNGHDGSALDPGLLRSLALRYRALGAAGAAHPFVPSFFVVAR